MAMKKVTSITRRRDTVNANIRRIVVTTESGDTQTLSTPIVKISKGFAFRNGRRATPVEQYAFQVGAKEVERFDSAVALVMRKHQIKLVAGADQVYIARAIEILKGERELGLTPA